MKLDYLLLLLPGLSDGVLLSGREGHSVGEEEVVSTREWPLLEATLCMVSFELQGVCNGSECCSLHLRRIIFLVRQEDDVLSLHALCCPPEKAD